METQTQRFNFFLKGTQDKAILLIHGITGTPTEIHYLGRQLNKAGFTVLCNTLPRHCDTLGELKKVTWQEIAEACAADLEKLTKEHSSVFVAGISLGALMAIHLAYQFPQNVCGIGALATTLFYDGWALHKGKIFMDLVWHIPLVRNSINIREGWPYGLKDENLREDIERFYKNASTRKFYKKTLLFGSPFFPMANLYQHHLFAKVVKQEVPQVKTPILIMHAEEDDMTSLRNAQYVYDNIGSPQKKLIVLKDSYHMITIDKEKERVAQELAGFFQGL